MGHIALRPQQARELLTPMHAPFSREIREERQGFAVGKGEPIVPVLHFRRPEQRNLQDTHDCSFKINACPIHVSRDCKVRMCSPCCTSGTPSNNNCSWLIVFLAVHLLLLLLSGESPSSCFFEEPLIDFWIGILFAA